MSNCYVQMSHIKSSKVADVMKFTAHSLEILNRKEQLYVRNHLQILEFNYWLDVILFSRLIFPIISPILLQVFIK